MGTAEWSSRYAKSFTVVAWMLTETKGAAALVGSTLLRTGALASTQTRNNTWESAMGTSLSIVGRQKNLKLVFECSQNGTALSELTSYECVNPEMPEPLKFGRNTLNGEAVWFAPSGPLLKDAPNMKAAVIRTEADPTQWMRVWTSSSTPIARDNAIVIATIGLQDYQGVYVQVEDVSEASFKMRLVTPSECAGSPVSQPVHVMLVAKGVHTGADGEVMIAERIHIYGDPETKIMFPSSLPGIPLLLHLIQHQLRGPPDNYMHSRFVRVDSTTVTLALETESKRSEMPTDYVADVGYLAIYSEGKTHGLFGDKRHYISMNAGEATAEQKWYKFPISSVNPFPFRYQPVVLLGDQSPTSGEDPSELRLFSVSPNHISVIPVEETCVASDNIRNYPGTIGFLAVEEKFEPVLADDCFLILEGHFNLLMAANGMTVGFRQVWQSVDAYGSFTQQLFLYWYSPTRVWNFGPELTGDLELSAVAHTAGGTNPNCPEDGLELTARGGEMSRIFRAAPSSRSLCVPSLGTVMMEPDEYFAMDVTTNSFAECARLVIGRFPLATAVSWGTAEGANPNVCYAFTRPVGKIDSPTETSTNFLGCVVSCNLLPGSGKPQGAVDVSLNEVEVGQTADAKQCAEMVQKLTGPWDGMTYRSGKCYAVTGMEGTSRDEAVSCFLTRSAVVAFDITTSTTSTSSTTSTTSTATYTPTYTSTSISTAPTGNGMIIGSAFAGVALLGVMGLVGGSAYYLSGNPGEEGVEEYMDSSPDDAFNALLDHQDEAGPTRETVLIIS